MSTRNTEALIGKTNRARGKALRGNAGRAHQTSEIPAVVAYPDPRNLKPRKSKKRRTTTGAINFTGKVNGDIKQEELISLPADAGFDDPAILIGLAIALGKRSGIAGVPDLILVPLVASAQGGCGASRLAIKWLERRTDFASSPLKPIIALTFEDDTHSNIHSIWGGHHG